MLKTTRRKFSVLSLSLILAFTMMPFSASANTYDSAYSMVFDGQWSSEQSIAAGDETWYRVDIPSDGSYELRLMNYSENDLRYELQSQDLSEEIFYGTVSSGSDISPTTEVWNMPLSKGTYYLRLYDYWGGVLSKYKIKNSFTSYGANDGAAYSFDSPQDYEAGTTITGLLAKTDQEDWFRLTVPKKGTYPIKMVNYIDYTLNLDIKNDDNSESLGSFYCSSGSPTSPTVENNQVVLEPGTYYIQVYINSLDGGKYSFTLTPPAPEPCTHDYAKKTIKPTYFKKGYTRYTCRNCGNVVKTNYKAKKKLPKGKVTSAKAKKNTVSVKWKKVKAASGYYLRYSTKKSMKGAKVIKLKKNSNTKTTLKKLKNKKTYYVQVRPYKTSEGTTVKGKWSSKAKVKIKYKASK